jgi:hypothetical protein
MGVDRIHRPTAGIRATGAFYLGQPFGWSQVFDYVAGNLLQEREFIGTYGPAGGTKYRGGAPARTLPYRWPGPGDYPLIWVSKADRQGAYDNIHAHAKMPDPDSPCGNVQIHAPFCGHSCVHMHWRWSSVSSHGAARDGWRYKGWSDPVGGVPRANRTDNAPLVPPNQQVVVALCRPGAARFNDDHLINPAAPGALDPLRKLIYYYVVVHNPNAGEPQVILSHGIGWGYRYATPAESDAMDKLTDGIADSLPWSGTPNQAQIATFFEEDVYPTFRYVGGLTDLTFDCTQQVPNGSWSGVIPAPWPLPARPVIAMEDL